MSQFLIYGSLFIVAIFLLNMHLRSKRMVRSFLSTALPGVCSLVAISLTAAWTGIGLNCNLFTLSVSTVLGLPGTILLLVFKLSNLF